MNYEITLPDGFTRKNLKASIKHILPITLIFALPIVLTLIVGWVRIDNSKIPWGFYLFFVFISSPSQEILYRGYLFHLLSEAGLNRLTSIGLSSILYSFVHLIYFRYPYFSYNSNNWYILGNKL